MASPSAPVGSVRSSSLRRSMIVRMPHARSADQPARGQVGGGVGADHRPSGSPGRQRRETAQVADNAQPSQSRCRSSSYVRPLLGRVGEGRCSAAYRKRQRVAPYGSAVATPNAICNAKR
jgi:hypothetical protein